MNQIKEKIEELKKNNKFFKFILNGKNCTIIILSFLLFCTFLAYGDSENFRQYNEIQELNSQLNELKSKNENSDLQYNDLKDDVEKLQNQITDLQNVNETLKNENTKLKEEKESLINEKNELENKNNELNKEIEQLKISKNNKVTTQNTSTSTNTPLAFSSSSSNKEKPTPNTTSNNTSSTYVINTNTNKFHYSNCSSVKQMKDYNRKDYSGSRDDLINKGYEPCQRCNP